MIKLNNPYSRLDGYNCFGCSPSNPSGLQMEFFEEGEEVISYWDPGQQYQGFLDVLHGGIQATLMDEIASWVVFIKAETAGVTYRMTTRFRNPVRISRGRVSLKATLQGIHRNVATIRTDLFDGEGTLCSEGVIEYYIFPEEKAVSRLHYPGKQAFYPS